MFLRPLTPRSNNKYMPPKSATRRSGGLLEVTRNQDQLLCFLAISSGASSDSATASAQ